ncbi:putative membrane protein [Paraburkholderia sp. UCT70]
MVGTLTLKYAPFVETKNVTLISLVLGALFAVVAAYTFAMAIFTMIMGNAFAAFPVMTAGIGLPLIVHQFNGNPAILGAIGMLSGFCGTLMTPMAANFNIVPAALLELKDQNGVIQAQWPTALLLLIVNTILLYAFVFRF